MATAPRMQPQRDGKRPRAKPKVDVAAIMARWPQHIAMDDAVVLRVVKRAMAAKQPSYWSVTGWRSNLDGDQDG